MSHTTKDHEIIAATRTPEPVIHSTLVDDSMACWIRWCGNPNALDAHDAYMAGLLTLGTGDCRYVTTRKGNAWLVQNAQNNGFTRQEAIQTLDYLDGIGC